MNYRRSLLPFFILGNETKSISQERRERIRSHYGAGRELLPSMFSHNYLLQFLSFVFVRVSVDLFLHGLIPPHNHSWTSFRLTALAYRKRRRGGGDQCRTYHSCCIAAPKNGRHVTLLDVIQKTRHIQDKRRHSPVSRYPLSPKPESTSFALPAGYARLCWR
jgi:hypothetical protein